jgi:hypothetical protein
MDIADGLVNGASGVLREVDFRTINGTQTPQTLWIEFDSPRIGSSARSRSYPRMFGTKNLTPVARETRDIQRKASEHKFVLVSRSQFPVVAAESITIHKSQGQTYEEVVVDVSSNLRLQLLYTALSRAKTSSGLYLVGQHLPDIKQRPQDHPLVQEIHRMETESRVDFKIVSFGEVTLTRDSIKAVFHNFPYLAKHSKDIEADPNYMSADILMFVETRSNSVRINGFTSVGQLEFTGSRPFGIAFYKRDELAFDFTQHSSDVLTYKGAHIELLIVRSGQYLIVAVYISPNFPKDRAIRGLVDKVLSIQEESRRIIIAGDFNVDINQSSIGVKLVESFSQIGLTLATLPQQSSNNHNNQIDLVFASCPLERCHYYESLFSDHKPINFSIPLH